MTALTLNTLALSYRPRDAQTNVPLVAVRSAHLEAVGAQLPGVLSKRLTACARQIERLVPKAEPRDFNRRPVRPKQWLEAFSYFPQGGPCHEDGDLVIAYRHHWPGFVKRAPSSRVLRAGQVPKSLEAMLRTLTPFCDELAWKHYQARCNVTVTPTEQRAGGGNEYD